jgi:DNA-binding protein HU-beta
MSLTTKDLIDQIAFTGNVTKTVAKYILDDLLSTMADHLYAGDSVVLKKFGRFHVKQRTARIGRNPSTGQEINIPAKAVVKFTPRGMLKS